MTRFGRPFRLWLCLVLAGVPGAVRAGDWIQVTSPHFLVQTDLSLENAREGAHGLEQLRTAVITAAWGRISFPEGKRTALVVFGNDIEFETLYGRNMWATWSSNPPRIVTYGKPSRWAYRKSLTDDAGTSVVITALVSTLSKDVYDTYVPWFIHGLGEYFATLELLDDGTRVQFGKVNSMALRGYRAWRSVSMRQVWAWDGGYKGLGETELAGYIGASWLAVHWMINTRPAGFVRYQTELANAHSALDAWGAAFPDMPVDKLDAELERYVRAGDYKFYTLPMPKKVEVPLSDRPIPPADLAELRRQLAAKN